MGSHRHNHKGQSAIEYLTTYGWALLAIGMVIAVLAAWGVFNPCNAVAPSFTGQQFNVEDWGFTNANTIQFEVRAVQNDVNITAANFTTPDGDFVDQTYAGSGWSEITAGTTSTLDFDVTGLFDSGECATADVTIIHDRGDLTGIEAVSSRPLTGPVP